MDKLNWSDNPEYLESLLAGYALGDLSPEEIDQVQAYLDAHPDAAAELAKLQTTLALLPLALPESQPSPGLKQRILTAAAPTAKTPSEQSPPETSHSVARHNVARNNVVDLGERRRSQRHQGLWFAGSIAAGLLAVLGFQNYKLSQDVAALRQAVIVAQQRQTSSNPDTQLVNYQKMISMLRQPDNRLITLKGMEGEASGSLVLVPIEQQAVLTLKNVPPLPQGRMYRLWAQVQGKKVYCTEFEPDAEGMVSLTIPLDQLGDAQSVAVTIDPQSADTAQPAGNMVMQGAISI